MSFDDVIGSEDVAVRCYNRAGAKPLSLLFTRLELIEAVSEKLSEDRIVQHGVGGLALADDHRGINVHYAGRDFFHHGGKAGCGLHGRAQGSVLHIQPGRRRTGLRLGTDGGGCA